MLYGFLQVMNDRYENWSYVVADSFWMMHNDSQEAVILACRQQSYTEGDTYTVAGKTNTAELALCSLPFILVSISW